MTKKEIVKPRITQENLQDYMYEIRGVKVLLSDDLAEAYGYEVKAFNRQVNNNKERFPPGFRFKLTKEELRGVLRCKNCTINKTPQRGGHYKYMPYVYTEYGVLMLGNVLRGPVAVAQSIEMVIAFKKLKDRYLYEQNYFPLEFEDVKEQTKGNTEAIEELKNDNIKIKSVLSEVVGYFSDPSNYKHFVIYNGQRVEADVIYQDIYSLAKKSLYIIDDYIGAKTLMLLKHVMPSIEIIIFSDDVNREKETLIDDYYKDTGKALMIMPTSGLFHDRYIVIDYGSEDEMVFHCGPSSKDAGNKTGTIMNVEKPELYHPLIDKILGR